LFVLEAVLLREVGVFVSDDFLFRCWGTLSVGLTRARDARGFEDDSAGANPSSVVMNINESHYLAIPWDKEGEGSRRVSGGPAQGGDVATTMETQCPVEDPDTATIAELSRETSQKQSLHLLGFLGSVLP
jgi:hypothetical protein